MKSIKYFILICCVLMFAQIGFAGEKIGIVDIQKIVNNSCDVQNLKQEHTRELEALNNIITEAQCAIANETNPQKIVQLQDKYQSEFNSKKECIENQYKAKLTIIEDKLKQNIYESAKRHNYDIVIAKSVVFYGGDDITDIISSEIK